MAGGTSRLSEFRARLAQLQTTMEAGLSDRAKRMADLVANLGDDTVDSADARHALRREAHKLRGVAGSFGHAALGDLAAAVEAVAGDAPVDQVRALAQDLIDAVDSVVRAAATSTASAPTTSPTATESGTDDAAKAIVAPRVLAVDDDHETRRLLDLTLRQLGGFTTQIAQSGNDGLAMLARERFDLVLCDAMMPDMNGMVFCERAVRVLREAAPTLAAADAPARPLPIVILSAATADELGWDLSVPHAPIDWWRKPFSPKELVADVRALVERIRTDAER